MAIQAHVSVLKAPPVYKWKTPLDMLDDTRLLWLILKSVSEMVFL